MDINKAVDMMGIVNFFVIFQSSTCFIYPFCKKQTNFLLLKTFVTTLYIIVINHDFFNYDHLILIY